MTKKITLCLIIIFLAILITSPPKSTTFTPYNNQNTEYYDKEIDDDFMFDRMDRGYRHNMSYKMHSNINTPLIPLVMVIAGAFWVYMLYQALTRPSPDKLVWILVLLFAKTIGAILYYFLAFKKDSTSTSVNPSTHKIKKVAKKK